MDIIISKHAKERMDTYNITEKLVKGAIKDPDEVVEGYEGAIIANKLLNEEHILRVVYTKGRNKRKIITVYPARKKRYWRSKNESNV